MDGSAEESDIDIYDSDTSLNDDNSTSKKTYSWTIKFKDSLQFLNSSLEKLVDNLKVQGDFPAMKQTFGHKTQLLLRKGVYPYDYMNSWDSLKR